MSKYHQLVQKYSAEIANIKALKARYAELVDKANANPSEQDGIFDIAEGVYQDLIEATAELDQDIKAEYADVPFAKPARAGIEGFWREAGLK